MFAPQLDREVLSLFNRPGTPWLDAVMEAASSGRVLLAGVALLSLYILFRTPSRVRGAVLLWVAIGTSDLFGTRVVKPLVARVRPCNSVPPFSQTLEQCGRGQSFPSNHASNAAAAATVLISVAPRLWPLGAILAALIGISRLYLGMHWPSDVLAGWLQGALLAYALVRLISLTRRSPTLRRLLYPELSARDPASQPPAQPATSTPSPPTPKESLR
jgi:membrane-associated phospholipid phosphatase